MRPPVFDQVSCFDGQPVEGIACDPAEDKARQEFAADVDVNRIVRKYGVGLAFGAQPRYGEQDFDTDLLQLKMGARRLVEALRTAPAGLAEKYASEAAVLQGLSSGALFHELDKVYAAGAEAAKSAASASGAGQAEGASGSAS